MRAAVPCLNSAGADEFGQLRDMSGGALDERHGFVLAAVYIPMIEVGRRQIARLTDTYLTIQMVLVLWTPCALIVDLAAARARLFCSKRGRKVWGVCD